MTPNPDRRNAMRLSLHVAALNSIPFSTAQGAADQKPKENDSMPTIPPTISISSSARGVRSTAA